MRTCTLAREERCEQVGDELCLCVRAQHAGQDDEGRAFRAKLLERWEASVLKAAFPQVFATFEPRMGVHASAVRVRRMKSRWGSCNTKTGTITLNTELVRFPVACLESVVVHELCHLVVPNHGPAFHALMDQHYPTWPQARKLLNASPPA